MQVSHLAALVRKIKAPQAGPMLAALAARLDNLVTIGLGYLAWTGKFVAFWRESQRVKMVRHLALRSPTSRMYSTSPRWPASHDVGGWPG